MDLFHTARVHVARFDALRDRIAPGMRLTHHVHEDWLDRARTAGVTDALADEIKAAIHAGKGTALCTCTTLGPVAEAAGALRIDRPLMEEAAQIGGRICLVYCLESTAESSEELLQNCILARGHRATLDLLCLKDLWPLFETGQTTAFAQAIANAIRMHRERVPDINCIVLAQASMDGAALHLTDLGIPVLAAPELAFRAALIRQ